MANKIPCPVCKGLGKIVTEENHPEGMIVTPNCLYIEKPSNPDALEGYPTCENCNGTGEVDV